MTFAVFVVEAIATNKVVGACAISITIEAVDTLEIIGC